jgi:hypothetical protein
MVEKVVEEIAVPRAADVETSKKVVEELAGSGSSPAPVMGAKRVATPGSSTPPAKQFCGSWKPQYAKRLRIYFFILCLTRVKTV